MIFLSGDMFLSEERDLKLFGHVSDRFSDPFLRFSLSFFVLN